MTSKPASRNARATTFAPRSCPSSPGLPTKTRSFLSAMCVSFALINQKNNIIGHFLWTFADSSFLDTFAGRYAGLIIMLYLPHLGNQVSCGYDPLIGVATGQDQLHLMRLVSHERQRLVNGDQ